jgi:hypothetical protein
MGSRNSSNFKYGPGLLLDKNGCIIDTVGYNNRNGIPNRCHNNFDPCNPCNPCNPCDSCKCEPIIENKSNKFQCQLANQVQNIFGSGALALANDPNCNMFNTMAEQIQSFENDLFMPFMQPFSTYCPQPFETPIYPPFAMPRPLPLAQQDFLMPFSNFCKQTYPKIQTDPTILPQMFTPFTQMFFQNSLPTQTLGPQFANIPPTNQFNLPPNASNQFNLPPISNKQYNLSPSNALTQYNPQSVPTNQFNQLQTVALNQLNAQPTGMNQLNSLSNTYNMQLYPYSQLNNNIPNSQQPTMTFNQKYLPQSLPNSFLSNIQSKYHQQNALQNQAFPTLSTNIQPTGFYPIQTESGIQSSINAPYQQGFQFPQNYPFQQIQPNLFLPQFPNINNMPTNSIMEHLSQVMINQPIQRTNFFTPFTSAQKQFKEQMAQVNLIPTTSNFKPIHIENQNPSVQFIIPPNQNIDPRNTQPFDQQGLPNTLNIVRDSLGPRPLPQQSFDTNSFANPFLSLHSLISQQQPMNEPFAQSIEFLMNSG